MKADADENLMLRYKNGDVEAFETLYSRHKGALHGYLSRQCINSNYADELFQDTWMSIIKSREKYVANAKFNTYLYHIAHNKLIDHYRRSKSGLPSSYCSDASPIDDIPTQSHEQPEQQASMLQKSEKMLTAISLLPEAQREAFLMREESGLSLEEISEITGVNKETAKSRLRYAINQLRKSLTGVL